MPMLPWSHSASLHGRRQSEPGAGAATASPSVPDDMTLRHGLVERQQSAMEAEAEADLPVEHKDGPPRTPLLLTQCPGVRVDE